MFKKQKQSGPKYRILVYRHNEWAIHSYRVGNGPWIDKWDTQDEAEEYAERQLNFVWIVIPAGAPVGVGDHMGYHFGVE